MLASIKRMRWVSLAAGIITWPAIDIVWEGLGDPTFGTWQFVIGTTLVVLVCLVLVAYGLWVWLTAPQSQQTLPALCQRSRAALLHPAPIGDPTAGFLCGGMAHSRRAQVPDSSYWLLLGL